MTALKVNKINITFVRFNFLQNCEMENMIAILKSPAIAERLAETHIKVLSWANAMTEEIFHKKFNRKMPKMSNGTRITINALKLLNSV